MTNERSIQNDVRVAIYRSFIDRCQAPQDDELAQTLDAPGEDVAEAMRELASQDVIAFAPGTERLWLAHPFCADDAPFTVTSGDKSWPAICIWDALGIFALVESDGQVSTACPDCDEPLRFVVNDGRVEGPDETVVHFGIPARRWYEDVGYT